jgi:hypothetical protein
MESDAPGCLIEGRYRLGTVVGRGGMGVVWQARDEILGRDVAVKELTWPGHFSAGERQAARRHAVREARAAARLSHRNVIQVFDILEEDGRPWIVMELIAPRSLRDLIKESLADVTTASMVVGSPAYIAPERARGRSSGAPADLWGLGASLYAAVEGRGPFEREGGGLASLTAVVADEPELAAHAGPLLWPVISGLLRKDPGERLDAVAAERMLRLVVAADSPVGTVARRPRRSPAATAAAALVGSAALAVVAVSATAVLYQPSQARHQTRAAAASSAARPSAQPTSPPTSGTGSRDPAVGVSPGTHLTSRTSPGLSVPVAGSVDSEAGAQPDNAVPPGRIGKSAKPGKGKAGKPGKGKGG